MMLLHPMKTVALYTHVFVWLNGISSMPPPSTIVEDTVLDYNLHFWVTFGKFTQTYEGTLNDKSHSTIDAMLLGPNGNI